MKRKIAIAICALAIAVPGIAQQYGGPPAGGQQPPRMGPGMGRMGGPNILMAPDVQKELNLTTEQKAKLGALFERQGGGQDGPPRNGFGGPPPGQGGGPGGQGGPPPQQGGGRQGGPPQGDGPQGNQDMVKRQAEMDAKIKAILNDAQYARYQELTLQLRGAEAMTEKKVADRVGLSEDQRKQIRIVLEENRPTPPRQGQGGERPDFEQMRKQMEARKKLINDKILAVLSSEQKATWTKMLGKAFTFQQPAPPNRGGN